MEGIGNTRASTGPCGQGGLVGLLELVSEGQWQLLDYFLGGLKGPFFLSHHLAR